MIEVWRHPHIAAPGPALAAFTALIGLAVYEIEAVVFIKRSVLDECSEGEFRSSRPVNPVAACGRTNRESDAFLFAPFVVGHLVSAIGIRVGLILDDRYSFSCFCLRQCNGIVAS